MEVLSLIEFWDAVFKGIGVVQFFDSSITGVIFLIGVAVYSRRLALLVFLGSLLGTLVGMGLGASAALVSTGFFGFNSILTAEALWLFLTPTRAEDPTKETVRSLLSPNFWYALLGASITSITFSCIAVFLSPWNLPALTAPFVLTTWFFLWAVRRIFVKISGGKGIGWWMPWPMIGEKDKITAGEFIKSIFRGCAQVMFCDSWVIGVIFVIGYTLGGIRYPWPLGPQLGFPPLTTGTCTIGWLLLGGVIGWLGSLFGTLMGMLCGVDAQSIKHGLYGFNGVLCAIALCGVLPGFGLWLELNFLNFIYGVIIAAAVSSIVMAVLTEILGTWDTPAFTMPFIITTLVWLYCARWYPDVWIFA